MLIKTEYLPISPWVNHSAQNLVVGIECVNIVAASARRSGIHTSTAHRTAGNTSPVTSFRLWVCEAQRLRLGLRPARVDRPTLYACMPKNVDPF